MSGLASAGKNKKASCNPLCGDMEIGKIDST